MQKRDLVKLRAGLESDLPFIYASWLHGLRHENYWFGLIDQDAYFKNYHDVIEGILSRANCDVSVACLVEDDDVILGYSVTQPKILHWVFVRPAWRGIGIARDIVPTDIEAVTHFTKLGLKIKPDHVTFNPFL